jgi:hypothetical protein
MTTSVQNRALIAGISFILAMTIALSYSIGWQAGVPIFFLWVGGIYLSLPAIVVALVLRLWRCAVLAGVLFLAALTYPSLVDYFAPIKAEHIKRYVSNAVPYLEAYRKEHGTYPEHLSSLKDLPSPPWFLKYGGNVSTYGFEYPSWGDMDCFDFWEYGSGSDYWQLHT